jgi:protocatechuate 3,4-dioxygenase beta subunit
VTGAGRVSTEVAALLDGTEVVCRDWAEQLEGPYRRGGQPVRRDLVEDRDGVALRLGLRLLDGAGHPLTDGDVEVWHCDALGRYSGYPPPADDGEPVTEAAAPRGTYLPDQDFLRGRQPTDENGTVEFATLYPGWYPGRTVHIHVMAHARGRAYTSQLYFPDEITDAVFARPPYRERPGRDTTNATDEILPTGGEPAVLDLRPFGEGYLGASRLHLPSRRGAP